MKLIILYITLLALASPLNFADMQGQSEDKGKKKGKEKGEQKMPGEKPGKPDKERGHDDGLERSDGIERGRDKREEIIHPGKRGMVKICHYPEESGEDPVTITISENAWAAHRRHGDRMGACEGAVRRTGDRDDGRFEMDNYDEARSRAYSKIEEGREMTGYAEQKIREAEERLEEVSNDLENKDIEEEFRQELYDEVNEARLLIKEIEQEKEKIENKIEESEDLLAGL